MVKEYINLKKFKIKKNNSKGWKKIVRSRQTISTIPWRLDQARWTYSMD